MPDFSVNLKCLPLLWYLLSCYLLFFPRLNLSAPSCPPHPSSSPLLILLAPSPLFRCSQFAQQILTLFPSPSQPPLPPPQLKTYISHILSSILPLTQPFCSLMTSAFFLFFPSYSCSSLPPLPMLSICSGDWDPFPFSRGPCMSLLASSLFISFFGSVDRRLVTLTLCLKSTYECVHTMFVFL